jgi:hypothetical protein
VDQFSGGRSVLTIEIPNPSQILNIADLAKILWVPKIYGLSEAADDIVGIVDAMTQKPCNSIGDEEVIPPALIRL